MGEQSQARARTALVLDDEAQIGAFVCKALTSAGFTAKQYTDPLQFLLQVQRFAPDLIILDLALGRSDAVDVMRKLDTLKYAGSVLLVSGRDEATLNQIEQIGRARGLIMLPSLQKPFRIDELRQRVQIPDAAKPEAPETAKSAGAHATSNEAHAILAQALQQDLLEVWYQPKIDLKTLSVCGAEALIRARHPRRGILTPAELLPSAGDPLHKPLCMFVIRRVIGDWALFAAQGRPLKLAINVPVSILSAPGFVDYIRNALPTEANFPGLIVEVTEDEVIRDLDWIREVATQLRLYNVTISIDDFGSAYASLSRLKELPFGEVKLDRSFVSGCGLDTLKRSLCQTVVDLAHCFSASACAEGIETVEDLRCLMTLGFNTAQGFIFAKPMPRDQFLEFIARPSGGLSGFVAPAASVAIPAAAAMPQSAKA